MMPLHHPQHEGLVDPYDRLMQEQPPKFLMSNWMLVAKEMQPSDVRSPQMSSRPRWVKAPRMGAAGLPDALANVWRMCLPGSRSHLQQ
jgi:hypothetical protein